MKRAVADDFQTFIGTYRFDGEEWGFEVQARSWGEAQARVRAMGLGRIDGELAARIPAGPGWLAQLLCAVRNKLAATRN